MEQNVVDISYVTKTSMRTNLEWFWTWVVLWYLVEAVFLFAYSFLYHIFFGSLATDDLGLLLILDIAIGALWPIFTIMIFILTGFSLEPISNAIIKFSFIPTAFLSIGFILFLRYLEKRKKKQN